jgi:hypothetical protein
MILLHSCHSNICLALVVASFLATTWAQNSNLPASNGPITNGPTTNGPTTNGPITNGPTVNCGEPATDTANTPTTTCCSQANGMVVRNSQGQTSGCVIADYSQPAVASAFQSCCSQQMVIYSAVGKQAPDDFAGM